MKQFSKLFFAAAVAALGLASCAKEVAPVETPKDNLVTVHFGATAGIEGATKATLTTDDELTFTSAWENKDALSVKYSYYNETTEATTSDVVAASWATNHFVAEMPEGHGMWDYNVVYPAPDADSKVDFGSTRTQKGNVYNSKYDLMKGSAIEENADAGKTADGKDIVFNMTRQTAIAYFHLTSTLDEEVVSAKLSVTDGNIASSIVMLLDHTDGFDLSTKDLNEITITFEEGTAPKASNFQLWYNVLPTEYSKMTLTVETTGHTLTISRTVPKEVLLDEYVAGKLYKVSKSIPREKWVKKGGETPGTKDFVLVTSAQSDWSGSYLLVGVNDVDYYAFDESINTDSEHKWGKCSKVVVDNNTIASTYGTMALEIVPGTAENTYSILTPSGKYLSASAAKKFNLSETYSADNCDFAISFGNNNEVVIKQASSLKLEETKHRQIRYNSNSNFGLRWYDGVSVNPVYLYKGPSKTALETPANLQVSAAKVVSWDAVSGAASYNVTIGTETFTSESNSYNASALADEYYDVTVVAVPSDKENYKNSAAATLTGAKFGTPTLATPTLKEGVIDGASISVSWSVDERATAGYNCELFKDDVKVGEGQIVKVGSVTFTGLDAETAYVVKVNAVAVEGTKAYAASPVATLEVTTKAATAAANDGSLEHPYTAAEAIAAIKANTGSTGKYVKGIVKADPSFNATYSSLSYDIVSGEATLYIYSGQDLGNAGFVGAEDLKAGDEVVVLGTLKKYTDKAGVVKYELDKNNYLISINGETQIYRGLAVSGQKTAFTVGDAFKFGGKALQVWRGKADVDVTASATFSGYDMSTEGKQTVTVTIGEETVTYEINVRAAGGEAPKAYILTFPGTDEAEKVNDYTSTWDATRDGFTWKLANWNNYNNGWKQVKAGRKKTASVATITTKTTIPEAISTVTMTIDAINATYVNSIMMEVISATGATIETIPGTAKKGPCVFNVTKPQNDCKYKITVDCKGMSGNNAKNGFVQVSKVVYTNN